MIPRQGGFPVSQDVTLTGVKITGMASLTADDGAVILPKLFRPAEGVPGPQVAHQPEEIISVAQLFRPSSVLSVWWPRIRGPGLVTR